MRAWGYEPSSMGTYSLYENILKGFIQDIRDDIPVPGTYKFDTLMTDAKKSIALAQFSLELLQKL
jgi:LPPG:FO 2-phospho-L-lactate transferase